MAKKKKRLSMRKIREILRLRHECQLSKREIGRSIKASHTTVSDYLHRASKVGISWPLEESLSEEALHELLFPRVLDSSFCGKPKPDYSKVLQELKKKGVTLFLLWEEYREMYPQGYGYTQFCNFYRDYKKSLDYSLRQDHQGGEKLFVDYAGQTIPIHNAFNGEVKQAQIFVSCLGASNYTYSEATWTQSLPDWIQSHIHSYEYFQGVPHATVPDNLKSGVKRACYYDPDINPTYQDMAEHYGTAIVPTRVRKPKDKAKVEAAVLVVERWILASLRHHRFYSLHELNEEIKKLLEKLNTRPFKKIEGCRKDLFEKLDRPALKPLPEKPYEYAKWKYPTVNIDYHVEIDRHYYSVPYEFLHKKLEARITSKTIEIFFKGKRIASHPRSGQKGGYTTLEEHRPKRHREYLKWNPVRILSWAGKIGPHCQSYLKALMENRQYPEQGYRACLGVLRLSKTYPHDQLESACLRSLELKVYSYKMIEEILKKYRYQKQVPDEKPHPVLTSQHANVRGKTYYQSEEEEPC